MTKILLTLVLGLLVPIASLGENLPMQLQGLGLRESGVASRDVPGWKKPQKILVVSRFFGPQFLDAFEAIPGVELVKASTLEGAIQAAPGSQVIVMGFCDQAVFDKADQLHWVQVYFAGVEGCVDTPAIKNGVLLSNGQRLSSTSIGDHAMALTYALVRGIDRFHTEQMKGNWNPDALPSLGDFGEVSGRTMLVVGLGGIGTQVAKRAHAAGMRVLATRGSRREGPDYVEYVGLADEAIKLAREADVVVNAAPLTASTRGMFNREFFAAMKPTAYFISVGRGQSTVTDDLIAALKNGEIAGAGLDVSDPEPLPAGHPLWTMPRVIITPHVAAFSARTGQRIVGLVKENLRRYIAGEPLLSVVDVERGY